MAHTAEIKGVGISVSDEGVGAPAVLLEARGEILPIFISPDQAQSMQLALEEVPSERPLTHDLLVEMLDEFGGSVEQVRIDDLADGTFYAKIDAALQQGDDNRRFVFDARPSDGIALALRVGCSITVTDDILDEAGRSLDEFDMNGFDTDDPEF